MKKWIPLFVLMMILNACEKKEASEPTLLVGKWQLSLVQGLNGKWEDAPPDSPILEILADGSINYTTVDGIKIPGCCSPIPYKAEGNKTILLRFEPEICNGMACLSSILFPPPPPIFDWPVTGIDGDILEVKIGDSQRKLRFRKLN